MWGMWQGGVSLLVSASSRCGNIFLLPPCKQTKLRCRPSKIDMLCVQGQHVRHLARRAVSPHGRITMVTGYIPADPLVADQTVLRAAKMASNLDILFHQWAEYRLDRICRQAQSTYKVSGTMTMDQLVVIKLLIDWINGFCDSSNNIDDDAWWRW